MQVSAIRSESGVASEPSQVGAGVPRPGRKHAALIGLTWLNWLVRDLAMVERVEDGLLLVGYDGREGLLGAVDRDGRGPQWP